jgi:hypothetical protein
MIDLFSSLLSFIFFQKKTASPFLAVGALGGWNQDPTFGFILAT